MSYQYKYTDGDNQPLHSCPACDSDLTQPDSVSVECCNSFARWEEPSCLVDGYLQDDHGHVAAGNHSATYCQGCGVMFINLDEVCEEVESS